MPDQTENADERPNVGQEATFRDDPSDDDIWPRDREGWKQEAGELRSQLDAAEAKLAETKRQLEIASELLRRAKKLSQRRCENLTRVRDDRTRERDEARAKLDQVRAAAEKFRSTDIAWPLMQEIPAVATFDDELDAALSSQPVTDREEPAQEKGQRRWSAAVQRERDELNDEIIETLAADHDRLKARIDSALGEIEKWWGSGKPGDSVLMSVNSILRGNFDYALTVTLDELSAECAGASEEPAGETKPRVWNAGDPEPPVGTTVRTNAGHVTTRYDLGWYPGPWNWHGLLKQGSLTESTSTSRDTPEADRG
ncbi:hypothetical protein [Amycolatopsis echigonensis]|uniref:Uncharacterized protein n=1 Tax=Amycolatopsis echigonensis TaxID=2576905 RepID=A0A8E1W9R3_9PSEU|nr:hypothetical protein [Amycolatopsis echigonensis]MBB2506015.1 hypothetical protein [Amycolatopsis echigonensis]